jgi:hypothetical protein
LSKFVALVQLHEKQGWNKLPPRKTWQEFGDKYRAKTPDMWQQWAHRLKDELITLKVQLRQCKKKRHAKRDSAGLALGVKSYMLRHTCPDTDEIDTEQIPAQEQKVVATYTEVWNQESADDGLADEEWFQDHAKEVREKIGGKEIKLDVELVREALQSTASWKAPGFDGVFGFFLKRVEVLHQVIVEEFKAILNNKRTQPLPAWFTTGRTVLIAKDRRKHVLADDNARPINCLPGLYKLFTKTLERAIVGDLEKVLTDEQKGCRSRVYGAQHQLLIDRVITDAVQRDNKDLAQVWLDMRKAFDSVSHK